LTPRSAPSRASVTLMEEESSRHLILTLLLGEVQQQRNEHLSRASGLSSRATILISAASIVIALQSAVPRGGFTMFAAALGATTAVIALYVLWPRGRPSNPPLNLELELWDMSSLEAKRALLHRQAEVLLDKDRKLRSRGRALSAGFATFAGTVVCSALAIVLST
jgi:hypothetical protein